MLHKWLNKNCDTDASNGKNRYSSINLWKGGLQALVTPKPPQYSNSSLSFSISECDDVEGQKLSINFTDLQASHYNDEIMFHI